MDARTLTILDKALEEVASMLVDHGWADEAAWYDDLRQTLQGLDPQSAEFSEVLAELESSFLGLGSLTDIPLADLPADALLGASQHDNQHQRWGLVSCATGIIQQVKKGIR
jgi:hypothetical protein